MTAAATEVRSCPRWCEDSEVGHDGAPCRYYGGSLTSGHMSVNVVAERYSDGEADVVLTHDWRGHVETIVLTPTQARMVARFLDDAAKRVTS